MIIRFPLGCFLCELVSVLVRVTAAVGQLLLLAETETC